MINGGRQFAALLTVVSTVITALGCTSEASSDIGCPGGEVVGWGDSLTWSAVKDGEHYKQADPTWLQTLSQDLGVKTKNFGEPSQGSAEIAVRQGGLKPTVTLINDEIRSGTTDASSISSISPSDGWSQTQNSGTMKMRGNLAGVPGTLEHTPETSGGAFAFVPDNPPDRPVPVPPGTEFIGNQGYEYRTCVQIIWAGTNNSRQDAAILRDVASMVNYLRYPKRYLVVGTIPGTRDGLAAAYGSRFVDLRSWLVTDGLPAAGVPASPDDTAATASGQVPPSLYGDGTHFTQAAYTAIGHHLASVLRAQGWDG